MNQHKFEVSGSTGNKYDMYVSSSESGRYSVRCYCMAGKNKRLCKHAVAIANFDFSYLLDSADEAIIRQILEPTTIQAELNVKIDVKKELDKQIARLQREKKKVDALISDMLGIAGGR